MKLRLLAAIIGIAIGVAPALGAAQSSEATAPLPAYRGRLLGVYNASTAEPIEGAEIADVLSGTSALSTKTGTVSLSFLPDGGSLVRIKKIGFQPTTIMVAISPADTVPFTILLKPAVQTLPTVVTKDSVPYHTSPALRAFEERRRVGIGKFITEVELRKNDVRTMSNVIRELGVNVKCTARTPIKCYALSTRAGCEFDVYVDGNRVSGQDRDLEAMHVDLTGAVEAYFGPATIPTEYNMTGSSCGVLLFWTRERH
jgi:hypothetical protein